MWKIYIFSFSLLIILWFLIICLYKSYFVKTTLVQVNFFDNIQMNKTNSDDLAKKVSFKRKIKHHIPRFMLELYENGIKTNDSSNGSLPDIVRSVIPKNAVIMEYENKYKDFKDNHLLIFDVPASNEDEEFIGAELKILSILEMDANSLIGLQKVVKISIYDQIKQQIIPLEEINAIHTNKTWLSFNLTKTVKEILLRNENFLKVIISIKTFLPYITDDTSTIKFKLSLLPIEEDFEHDYPILLLTYSSSRNPKNIKNNARSKRSIDYDYTWDDKVLKRNKRIRNNCKRRSLYVDFGEIQYDTWIVQPSGYEAYQCQGKCFYPVADHLSPTKHAIIQALLHSVDPTKVPRTCCVPTKLSSISVLYVDEKGVLTYRFAYKDMVVSECGCR